MLIKSPPRFFGAAYGVISIWAYMDLINSLTNLGLNEKEARIYLALLKLKQATAGLISKHSGLKRSTAYAVLEDMIDQGIVDKVPRKKIMQYTAISPEELFSVYKSRIENAKKEALPELKALSRDKEHKIRVSYYEGLAGIKEMYKRVYEDMPSKEFVGFSIQGDDAPKELLSFLKQQNKEYKKLNIRRRLITSGRPENEQLIKKTDERNNITTKALLRSKDNSSISIEIYKDYIQIFSSRYSQAVVIESEDAARALKQIFNIVWESDKANGRNGFKKDETRIA